MLWEQEQGICLSLLSFLAFKCNMEIISVMSHGRPLPLCIPSELPGCRSSRGLYHITCVIMITMEHRVFEIKFLDFGLTCDRRHEKLLNQDSLLIQKRLMKKLFYLPPFFPLKDPVITAEQQYVLFSCWWQSWCYCFKSSQDMH